MNRALLAHALTRGRKCKGRGVVVAGIAAVEPLEARQFLSATSFSAPISYNIGSAASPQVPNVSSDGVAAADFNGDGKADLAVAHSADNTVDVLINNGNGSFKNAVAYATGSTDPIWVTVSDVNGDGKKDLLVLGTSSGGGLVSVFIGNGDGTFKPVLNYGIGTGSRGGVAAGDFNGDGKPDLAVVQFATLNSTQSPVDILINNGDGTFKPYYTVGIPPAPRAVALGDFNHDNKLDMAIADGQGYNNVLDTTNPAGVTILFGNGNGTFTSGGQYDALPTPDAGKGGGDIVNPEAITTAELNNDGNLDVIESLYDHNIDVFLGNANGTFKPAVGFNTGEYPRAVAVADVNQDGTKDLIVANVGNRKDPAAPEAGSIAVLLGNGNGTFQSPVQYTPFNYTGGLAAADFDGDGLPDIAASRVFDGHSVNVMFDQNLTSIKTPTVTSVSPASGSTGGGTAITITGTNFLGATAVTFGTVKITSWKVTSPTTISATSPTGAAGTVDIHVTNSVGTSLALTGDHFTFVATALPAPITVGPGSTSQSGPVLTTTTPTFTWKTPSGVSFSGYQLNIADLTANKYLTYNISPTATSFTVPAGALTAGDKFVWGLKLQSGTQLGPSSVYLYFQIASSAALPHPTILSPGTTAQPGPVLTTTTPTFTWQPVTATFDTYQLNIYNLTQSKFYSYQISKTATSFVLPAGVLASGDAAVWNLRLRVGTTTGPESTYFYFRTA